MGGLGLNLKHDVREHMGHTCARVRAHTHTGVRTYVYHRLVAVQPLLWSFTPSASVAPPVEWGCLELEAEARMPWPLEVSPCQGQEPTGSVPAGLPHRADGAGRCLLKPSSTQGCFPLTSEVRISPRQAGVARATGVGRAAWRPELGCWKVDYVCSGGLLQASGARP